MNHRKKRIRVLEPKPAAPSFARRVESKARQLTHRRSLGPPGDATLDVLTREMALTLDQIEGVRRAHHQSRKSLLRQECYLDTEIMQREPRPPVYEDPRIPERDRLRDRLRFVERERRKLLMSEGEQLRPLQNRLLSLLNRHNQLHI